MKTFSFACFMLFSIFGFTQNKNEIKSSNVKTTYEEYNFLTERYGYDDKVEMLEGYELQDFFELTLEKFNFNYKLFVEVNNGKTKAILITITKIKKKDDKVRYLCMPINNGTLFKKFNSEAEGLGVSMTLVFEALNKALLSKLIDEKINVNAKKE